MKGWVDAVRVDELLREDALAGTLFPVKTVKMFHVEHWLCGFQC
jgi:hypothetical protein